MEDKVREDLDRSRRERGQDGAQLRKNNFDLLRFIFAFTVMLVHAATLSGASNLAILGEALSSEVAVRSFFIVSGFLIFMSYENSISYKEYFSKRLRRIYPAYVFVVVAVALAGGFVTSYRVQEYFSQELLKYLAANLVFLNFLHPDLPGVFVGNAYHAVNGALWTLKIEVMFYLLVPFVVMLFKAYGRLPVLLILYIASLAYSLLMSYLASRTGSDLYFELQRQLPGQLSYFLAGALGYYYLHHLSQHATKWLLIAVGGILIQNWLPWGTFQVLALGVLVVYFACVFPFMGNFGKYGDFSYGIYILHFPVLQTMVACGLFRDRPWGMLVVAIVVVLVMAFMLWHLIEKPFLGKRSHYVEAEARPH